MLWVTPPAEHHDDLVAHLESEGLLGIFWKPTMRFVTHLGIDDDQPMPWSNRSPGSSPAAESRNPGTHARKFCTLRYVALRHAHCTAQMANVASIIQTAVTRSSRASLSAPMSRTPSTVCIR